MLRRFAFVVIAMLLFEKPWLQAILYCQISFLALILVLNGMPFSDPVTNALEILNEVFVLIIGYHVCSLTGFQMERHQRKALGTSIIILVCILIAIHYIRWGIGVYHTLKLKYARRKNVNKKTSVMNKLRKEFKEKLQTTE